MPLATDAPIGIPSKSRTVVTLIYLFLIARIDILLGIAPGTPTVQ